MKTEHKREFSVLLSEDCGVDSGRLTRLAPSLKVAVAVSTAPSALLRSRLAELPADALILGGGDFDLAAELSAQGYTATLILTDAESLDTLRPACIAAGILADTRENWEGAVCQLLATCARLRLLRQRESSLQRRLDDTRLVSRAKLLLMSRLQMSETEAHRYIEKTAMDTGARRRDVAVGIIRAYEE